MIIETHLSERSIFNKMMSEVDGELLGWEKEHAMFFLLISCQTGLPLRQLQEAIQTGSWPLLVWFSSETVIQGFLDLNKD